MSKGETIQSVATAVGTLAVPVVLAVFGYRIQAQIADQGVAKDYVQIAATILKEDAKSQEPELREWAVSVLSKYSPLPFSSKAKSSLQSGMPGPGLPLYAPPEDCLVPARSSKIAPMVLRRPKDLPMTEAEVNQLLKLLPDDLYELSTAKYRLSCMQNWYAMEKKTDDDYRAAIGAMSSASEVEMYKRASKIPATGVGGAPSDVSKRPQGASSPR